MSSPPGPTLPIAELTTPTGATLGLTHCPGRSGGPYGQRDLAIDIARIEAWGARVVVSLNESDEFPRLGVPNFTTAMADRSFRWCHVPVADFGTPSLQSRAAWNAVRADIEVALQRGERVLIHCAAGLGRTGTIAAKLLADLGVPPDQAIAQVRHVRPGAVETEAQKDFVRSGPPLLD
jgi:ADP-ribosyl-[dinitrogen reductase] hydrolase